MLKPISTAERSELHHTIYQLRAIRNRLRKVGARMAALAVARALKSVEGADRHAQRRPLKEAP